MNYIKLLILDNPLSLLMYFDESNVGRFLVASITYIFSIRTNVTSGLIIMY